MSEDETAPLPPGARGRTPPASHHVLVVHLGAAVEQFPLQPGRPVVIGREPPADIVVYDRSVSRRHARITLVGGEVMVDDLGSSNGTYVDQQRVDHAVVRIGQEIVLGDVIASVQVSRLIEVSPGGFDRHEAFVAIVEHEMRRARLFGGGGFVVFLRVTRGQSAVFRRLCAKITNLLRPVDRVAVYSAEGIEVLLPGATLEQAIELGRRARAIEPDPKASQIGTAGLTSAQGLAEDVIAAARSAACETPPGRDVGVFEAPATTMWSSNDVQAGRLLSSPGLEPVLELARRVAGRARSILIVGETGTGKELIARYLHEKGPRAAKPMVAVNCAGIPRDLRESTLFGHEKGAFTGAVQARRGVFQAADKGTVFLDEVGELSPGAQAALLRVLEVKKVTPVGAIEEIPVDVRIVAATHRDLEAMCAQGSFRQDLLHRLNTVLIEIPPLRARRSDIPALAEHFLREANRDCARSISGFDEAALELLMSYAWPGNARELRNALEYAALVAQGDRIAPEDLPERLRRARPARDAQRPVPPRGAPLSAMPAPPDFAGSHRAVMQQFESDFLCRRLEETGWTVKETARRLGLPVRTLQNKMKKLRLRKAE